MAISASLRCLVCQGESLYASHTGLAQDLRREIRSMIEQGRSDEEILDTLLARYGDLLRHDEAKTMDAFWWALAVLLLAAAAGLMLYLDRRHARSGFPARRY